MGAPEACREPCPSERKALEEFRARLEEAILGDQIFNPQGGEEKNGRRRRRRRRRTGSRAQAAVASFPSDLILGDSPPKDVSLWGVPLLPSKRHEGTDVLLLKFLRARELNAAEALDMLARTIRWRKQFGADGILDEDLGSPELDGVAYIDGVDRTGRPLCYNMYGAFVNDRGLCQRTFGDEQSRERFLRWRVQLMEKAIRMLSFKPGGAQSIVQINDLKNPPGDDMKELRMAMRKVSSLLQDNYPEFIAKNCFMNVSLWSYANNALFSRILAPKTNSKFIFARPSKVAGTLLRFIAPEELPIQYGGLKRENDKEFSEESEISEVFIRPGAAEAIEIQVPEPGVTVVWDVTVVGWEVKYREEFIPDDEGSYKVLLQKDRKLEECVRNSFYINEPGKIVLTIENKSFNRKRALYRSTTKLAIPLYKFMK